MTPGSDPLLFEILDALADPVILIDQRKVVIHRNAAAQKAWSGLSINSPLSFALRSPDLIEATDDVLDAGGHRTGELVERGQIERVYQFDIAQLSSSINRNERGHAAAVLMFRDLTEAKRIEQMRADFVANASHELRTPLASLLGFIETLQGPAKNDQSALPRFLDIMRSQAKRMAHLIDDLLSLSRVEMSEHRQPVDRIDLNLVVRQIADSLTPMAREKSVRIAVIESHDPCFVAGDRDELLRVVENLVENAIKYGHHDGSVEISLVRADTSYVISVKDNGPGIAAEHLPRLTERFYRVSVTASRESGGTGLGLAIVKHILNRHRGRLVIESEIGKGSNFKVFLPVLS